MTPRKLKAKIKKLQRKQAQAANTLERLEEKAHAWKTRIQELGADIYDLKRRLGH